MSFGPDHPVPPGSMIELKKLWPHARRNGYEKGQRWTVGHYSEQDGSDVIWMVNEQGEYEQTIDHEWLEKYFEVL